MKSFAVLLCGIMIGWVGYWLNSVFAAGEAPYADEDLRPVKVEVVDGGDAWATSHKVWFYKLSGIYSRRAYGILYVTGGAEQQRAADAGAKSEWYLQGMPEGSLKPVFIDLAETERSGLPYLRLVDLRQPFDPRSGIWAAGDLFKKMKDVRLTRVK